MNGDLNYLILITAFDKWQAWAEEKACCDFAFKMNLPDTLDIDITDEMKELTQENYGINCFKVSMDHGPDRFTDQDLIKFFDACTSIGCLANVQAVSGELVKRNIDKLKANGVTGPEGHPLAYSEEAEEEATMRSCTLANQMNCPLYLSTVSCSTATDIIRSKKSKGHVVYSEVTPAALACNGTAYWNADWQKAAALVALPPVRNDQNDALVDAITKGLDCVSSNHAAFNLSQKALGIKDFTKIPKGVNGVEERMSIIWEKAVASGKMTKERFVDVTSTVAAKIFGLYPDKGCIEVGSIADIVIWDPEAETIIRTEDQISKSDFNIFEGMTVRGKADTVILRGRVAVDEGQMKAAQGHGRFVQLSPYPVHVYEKIKARKVLDFQPVIRSEEEFASKSEDIPPPTPPKSFQPEKASSQHISQFDLKSHPIDTPITEEEPTTLLSRSTKHRSSIRIRNPPGGKTSGSFW